MNLVIEKILSVYRQRGQWKYGSEDVTQLEHALQCGTLAIQEESPDHLIAAALLHDIGHILEDAAEMPRDGQNYDDHHEAVGDGFLKQHFGAQVADPVRLHVAAKRYLCTKHPEYESTLSPTSRQSYYDQGGPMDEKELQLFESEPHFVESLKLRKWDDQAKDTDAAPPKLDDFVPYLERCLVAKA